MLSQMHNAAGLWQCGQSGVASAAMEPTSAWDCLGMARYTPCGKALQQASMMRPPAPVGFERLARFREASIGVPIIRERIFGQDYAKTLLTWRNNFREAWPGLTPLGFDGRFRRLREYYLAYCEAGFLLGNIDVRQVVFAKPD
jgi:hypothetical protein